MYKMKAKKIFSKSRLIGTALIILAVVGYYSKEFVGSLLAIIAGLILILAPGKTSQDSLDKFANSFKLGKEFVFIALFDALFYLSIFIFGWIFSILTKIQMGKLGLVQMDPVALTSIEVLESNIKLAQLFITSLIIYVIIFLLLFIISYTLFKGLIWLTLLGKRPSLKYFKKFFFTNLIWAAIWIIPAILALFGLKPSYFTFVAILELLLYIHLTSILHYSFTEKQNLKKAYSRILPVGFGKIQSFIIPYVYALIVYIIVAQVFRIIPQQEKVILAVALLLVLFYLAWFRNYIRVIVEQHA